MFSLVLLSLFASDLGAGPIAFEPASPRLGDLAIVYLKNGDPTVTRAPVRVFGYEFVAFRVSDDLLRGVIAIPMDTTAGDHPISILLPGHTELGAVHVAARRFDRSQLKVSGQFTGKKSKALLAQLAKEEREFKALFEPEPGPPAFSGSLEPSVPGAITAVFGTHRVFNGKTNSIHYGLDLDGKIGDPIRAVAGGKVVMSDLRWASGGTVIVDHGGGLFTAYFHMSKRTSTTGQDVKAGDLLGLVGKTGRVTGPHLHLGVLVRAKKLDAPHDKATRSFFVDPQRFLELSFAGGAEAFVPKRPTLRVAEPFGDTPADLPDNDG